MDWSQLDNTEIRAHRRKKYFGYKGHPYLSKLSEEQYKKLRENYFFLILLGGNRNITRDELDDYLDNLVLQNTHNPKIDWQNIKKYYVARYMEETSRKIPVTTHFNPIVEREKWLITSGIEDIRQVLHIIHKYEDIIQNDTFCLY